MKTIKFMYNGIKIDGKLHGASYSKCALRFSPEVQTITLYGKRYRDLPDIGVNIENNTEIQSDYFENDKIRINPGQKFYQEANEAWKKQEAHDEKTRLKRAAKLN